MKILKGMVLGGLLVMVLPVSGTVVYEELKENETVQTKADGKTPPTAAKKAEAEELDEVPPKVPPVPPPPAPAGAKPAEPPPLPAGQKGVSAGVFMIRRGDRTEVVLRNGETYVIRKDSNHNKILSAIVAAEQNGAAVSLTIEASTGRILSAGQAAAKSP